MATHKHYAPQGHQDWATSFGYRDASWFYLSTETLPDDAKVIGSPDTCSVVSCAQLPARGLAGLAFKRTLRLKVYK